MPKSMLLLDKCATFNHKIGDPPPINDGNRIRNDSPDRQGSSCLGLQGRQAMRKGKLYLCGGGGPVELSLRLLDAAVI
jgi:hypothetical protein